MKEGPSGSAIRSLIPNHRELLRSKAVVVAKAAVSRTSALSLLHFDKRTLAGATD